MKVGSIVKVLEPQSFMRDHVGVVAELDDDFALVAFSHVMLLLWFCQDELELVDASSPMEPNVNDDEDE